MSRITASNSSQDHTSKESHEKRIEQLEFELSRYKMAAEGASEGLWDWDLTQETPFVSTPWKTMLGFSGGQELELTGLWESLLHPDDRDFAIERFDLFRSGEIEEYNEVFRLKHTDGTYRWIRSRAKSVKDEKGNVTRISGSHKDITSRKRDIQQLEATTKKYRDLFQNSLVGIFRSDIKTGRIIESNDKVWEIAGYKGDESSSTIEFYKHPEDRQMIMDMLADQGKIEQVELEGKRANGESFWVSVSARLYKEEGFIETILIDITERQNMFLELKKVNYELDSFVYHASHDLRSPLSSILGLLNIYHHETNPSIKADCIDRIEGSVKRLDNLVRELLAISRNNRVDDPATSINFMVEINNSINTYFSGLKIEKLDIQVRVHQPVNFVSDLTRVRIILNNLISNAIKYRDTKKDMSVVQIEVHVDKEEARITIEDNGQGIDPSKQKAIFDMFYRANDSSDGSGLGLYIVKSVISKLNGKVEVNSAPGVKTIFSVTIPNLMQ